MLYDALVEFIGLTYLIITVHTLVEIICKDSLKYIHYPLLCLRKILCIIRSSRFEMTNKDFRQECLC